MLAAPNLFAHDNEKERGKIFDRDSVIHGRTYSEWNAAWQQWTDSIPTANHPLSDNGDCSQGQLGQIGELRAVTAAEMDGVTELAMQVDGEDIRDIKQRFRVQSQAFEFTLPGDNSGFVEEDTYRKLIAATSDRWLRALLAVAYTFGFRKGKLVGLRVKRIDLKARFILLLPGTTKNKKRRKVLLVVSKLLILRLQHVGL